MSTAASTAAAQPWQSALLHGCGLPEERCARIAARRAFVVAKQSLADCVDGLDPALPTAAWLARKVRAAQQPEDLWRLRLALSLALRARHPALLVQLRRSLEALFPQRPQASGSADTVSRL